EPSVGFLSPLASTPLSLSIFRAFAMSAAEAPPDRTRFRSSCATTSCSSPSLLVVAAILTSLEEQLTDLQHHQNDTEEGQDGRQGSVEFREEWDPPRRGEA